VGVRTFGAGPDVVFVHGWPVSGATFRHLVPLLAPHCTCHVLDLPGAGASRFDPAVPVSVAGHVEAVRAVVDALGLASFAVVGHDSGGLIARHALADDPRVRAWGLLDTEHPGRPGWRFRSILALRRLPALPRVIGAMLGWRGLRHLAVGAAFVDRRGLDGEFAEFFCDPVRRDPARRTASAQVVRSFDLAMVDALPEVHRRMTAPVRLVWGARDPYFPVAAARAMVPTFPDATLVVVDDAALFVHEEQPTAVAAALRPVLT
jgi:pimeloyl-ACP methyl ester carboxylesterase